MLDVPVASPVLADPYEGNILTAGLGPIPTRSALIARLPYHPAIPATVIEQPPEIRLHYLVRLREFYAPPPEAIAAATGRDLMLRSSYASRNPRAPDTWRAINGGAPRRRAIPVPAPLSLASGISGCGKTSADSGFASIYPHQVILHPEGTFKQIIGPHYQLVWLAANVHPSGKLVDIAATLMMAWDEAVTGALGPSYEKFGITLERYRSGVRLKGAAVMAEFLQAAKLHMLGLLLLDEISHFFKLKALRTRLKKGSGASVFELSLAEDESLKTILTISNAGIPIHFTGTDDGISALEKRLGILQRAAEGGHYKFSRASGPTDNMFMLVVDKLKDYQLVRAKLSWKPWDRKTMKVPDNIKLLELLYELTGGIWRLLICLWFAAHRVAFDRLDKQLTLPVCKRPETLSDELLLEDFTTAATTLMARTQPAVAAIRSNDIEAMRRYEDLLPREPEYWSAIWKPAAGNLG